MNLSHEEAQRALDDIQAATAQTRHLLRPWLSSVLVCGVVWVIAFGVAQWQPLAPVWSAGETMIVGIVCAFFFAQWHTSAMRFTPGSRSAFFLSRLPIFYAVLYAFFLLWQLMLDLKQTEVAALWITVVMLATITTGLLLSQHLFVWLGLSITALTAVGFWLVPTYFWLWIAAFAGLPLIVVSLALLRRH